MHDPPPYDPDEVQILAGAVLLLACEIDGYESEKAMAQSGVEGLEAALESTQEALRDLYALTQQQNIPWCPVIARTRRVLGVDLDGESIAGQVTTQ